MLWQSLLFVVAILLILLVCVLIEMVLMYLYFRMIEWREGREKINTALVLLQNQDNIEKAIKDGSLRVKVTPLEKEEKKESLSGVT